MIKWLQNFRGNDDGSMGRHMKKKNQSNIDQATNEGKLVQNVLKVLYITPSTIVKLINHITIIGNAVTKSILSVVVSIIPPKVLESNKQNIQKVLKIIKTINIYIKCNLRECKW